MLICKSLRIWKRKNKSYKPIILLTFYEISLILFCIKWLLKYKNKCHNSLNIFYIIKNSLKIYFHASIIVCNLFCVNLVKVILTVIFVTNIFHNLLFTF